MKVIVSGHSRGLGAAIVAELLSRGIAVLGLARQRNAALQAAFPTLLTQHEIDLADTAALQAWLHGTGLSDFIEAGDGRGAAAGVMLINNAGTVHPLGALDQLVPAGIAAAVALNVTAPLMLATALAAHKGGERRVLHISSGAGRDAYPGWGIYCATKAALDHHARAAAQDQSSRVRICSLAPGVIDTDMQADLRAVEAARFPLREQFEAMQRNGHLSTPAACAARLVDFALADDFGAIPVTSLTAA